MKHIYTSICKQNKVENTILVDVLQLTHEYDAPANVVILADVDNMARAVEILKMGGCRVYVVVPNEGRVGWSRWHQQRAQFNCL